MRFRHYGAFLLLFSPCWTQELLASEHVSGIVRDQTGAVIANVTLQLRGTEFRRTTQTDLSGEFTFDNIEAGEYELTSEARGFRAEHRKVSLHRGESVRLTISLTLESMAQQVTVAEGAADLSSLNVTQTQIGSGLMRNLPSESINAALSSILTLATPGIAADSNGVFHPLGEHAETSFSIDGQPISDQQSRIFSNQISVSTLQEMRTRQGAPPAEFGDKTSLIVEATTRSGLGTGKSRGSISAGYGTFQTPTVSVALASGSTTLGNFLALDGVASRRFLDAPEFVPLHAHGNAENAFDRFDWRPSEITSLHLSVSAARSWFQVPNTYDQQAAGQDQRQHMTSFNADVGFSRVLNPSTILVANTWVRQDRVNYFPSADLLQDQPATLSQSRRLTSTGSRSDVTYSRARHSVKAGMQLQVAPLSEAFSTGLTDPSFNSPCADATGTPVADASLTLLTQCTPAGYAENPSFEPALLRYDLSRGGRLFRFLGSATVLEESAYAQDSMKLGQFRLSLGLRYDHYDGLNTGSGLEPRAGVAYQLRSTSTVFHVSYARIFVTPYNENLVLSSFTGPGGLANGSLGAATVAPLTPARRNQFNIGFDQQLTSKLGIQAEYFWKFTRGAYDFNTILNTPLNFPIQFRKAKIDGAMVRATLNDFDGFSAFAVLGHTRSRLFSPEIGGINFGTPYETVARPDHDQGFQQTTNLQYGFPQKAFRGLWLGLTWRFDSGLVVVSVPDYETALTLSANEQQQIGLYCGDVFASIGQPLRACASPNRGATLFRIAPPGTYNADTNPSRITPRHLLDLAVGSESIWKRDTYSMGAKLTVVNLTDKVALYNFLSSFSGTHFLAPRTIQTEISFRF